jgi:hypothetical protein
MGLKNIEGWWVIIGTYPGGGGGGGACCILLMVHVWSIESSATAFFINEFSAMNILYPPAIGAGYAKELSRGEI